MKLTGEEAYQIWLNRLSANTKMSGFGSWARRFKAWLGRPIENTTPADIDRYIAILESRISPPEGSTERPLSIISIAQSLRGLKSLFDELCHHDVIAKNPVRIPDRYRKAKSGLTRPTGIVDFAIVTRIINTPSSMTAEGKRDRAFMALLFAGALRRAEALGLTLGDIDRTKTGTIVLILRSTKAGSWARQVLPAWANEYVEAVLEQRRSEGAGPKDKLLVGYRTRIIGKPAIRWNTETACNTFRKYCALFGFPKATPHWARATAITKMIVDKIPYREVQEVSRHASIAMVEYYDKRFFGEENHPAKNLQF